MFGKAAFAAALMLAPLLLATPAHALESAPVASSRVVATLITDADTVADGKPLHVALRLRLKPGWHTYWSNPGDAGAPPELKLNLSAGATAGDIIWPTPMRMPEGPVMAYGYTGDVVLPVAVTPSAGALEITANATWLVCEKICVPEEGAFSLTLPQGAAGPSAERAMIDVALERTPRPSPFAATIGPDGTLAITGAGLSPASVKDAWFFPAEPDMIDQAAPQRFAVDQGVVSLALHRASGLKPSDGLAGVAVLTDAAGQQSSLQIDAKPGQAAAPPAARPVWQVLVLALAGGLLLNLMPCVFPVLAMKAVSISKSAGQTRGTVRRDAAAYTAGVVLAFLGLAGLLIGLRSAGLSAGWGFQFQSPVFVTAMAWVLFAVGLNLSGVFEVSGRLAGAGQGLTRRGGYAGSFFTGLLAVLVATPCTAPFMGVAIATALAAPALTTVMIFVAMGLGLAAPTILLGVLPHAAHLLPRPGRWMDITKGVLAFPMYGASAWLVWVVSIEAGSDGVLWACGGLVLIAFAGWVLGLAGVGRRRLVYGMAGAAVLGAVALLPAVSRSQPAAMDLSQSEGFTPARLAALRAEGRPVFVNMTAAWCVTCLVNERVALSSAAVQQAFAAHNVAYLKGDWTRSDPAITSFLRDFDRDGVPLYVLYPAGQATPSLLPQILTEAEMLHALDKVGS